MQLNAEIIPAFTNIKSEFRPKELSTNFDLARHSIVVVTDSIITTSRIIVVLRKNKKAFCVYLLKKQHSLSTRQCVE